MPGSLNSNNAKPDLFSLASLDKTVFSHLLTDQESSKSDLHHLTIHEPLIRSVKLLNLLDFIVLLYYFDENRLKNEEVEL